ncbi:maleylpyruvate isomerase N-terminal domain-containing protein [Streptosporangium sp. NBC_01756]|uniref:maleylpyruvate isomerase N-terminal domain-containing protein n=1 Tax=Streptosporangium sp. NBC_01756 TaxID=2975950 RepID=UPI002DDC2D67|nr:maleylpyruvate isomerase N-terminal domain-containing protein [Streptosporangium sp. NBC_01756]WSC87846.1 maleylpyruvate isomerase N-terminal domain-containing protein [Streptosporangium sp. NBC_01756]
MAARTTEGLWREVRIALEENGDRFTELVAAVPDPQTMATKEWSVADTAAHLVAIGAYYPALLRPDDISHPFPDLAARILAVDVDGVAELNHHVMKELAERDPRVLAGRLQRHIGEVLRMSESLDPHQTVTWLGSSRLPVAGLLAHLVNELMIHGWDIARAVGAPWPMPRRDAGLFFDLFLTGLVHNGVGSLLDTGEPPHPRRIAVEFRSQHVRPVTLVLRDGEVTLEEPGPGADARLRFDPVTLNLMLFGRVSPAKAVLTRKIVITGRRPWLLPAFLRKVRLPANSYPGPAGADDL